MYTHTFILCLAVLVLVQAPLSALQYPAPVAPGKARTAFTEKELVIENQVLLGRFFVKEGCITSFTLASKETDRTVTLPGSRLPSIVLDEAAAITPEMFELTEPLHRENSVFSMALRNKEKGLSITWRVKLDDNTNAVIQTYTLTASTDLPVQELCFLDTKLTGARQVGQVDGSVVVCDSVFLAVEHPLAKNMVDKDGEVRCSVPRGNVLGKGETWRYSFAAGVVPQGQLRRGFLSYLEHRRPRPYQPFLHYNSWYHLNIGRPDNHMTEKECLETIEFIGRELVKKRKVTLDAFVWDDGWDDFNSLWGFHEDFPRGFKRLNQAAKKYNAAQGVWMSPWGGYGAPKNKRVAHGKSKGYETNKNGFSMAGEKYGAAFRNVCLSMMREHGVVFFKFDGMGSANGTGAANELADDIDAVLELSRTLRRENPDVFISATTGTWASPFWTLFADSIWRQGGDTSFYGPGNSRQKWITYRDMYCYRCIVQWGPLYPLNSLMLHGLCIGERANPARMSRDEKSVADEIWTFFGSGTNLQELYISPHLLTETMWNELAAAANWSRRNADTLIDSHWIGGDPRLGEVYGWASWQPGKAIVVLRNPSEEKKQFDLELARECELPDAYLTDYALTSLRPKNRKTSLTTPSTLPVRIELKPFEVAVLEAQPVAGAKKYDATEYRRHCAERKAVRMKKVQAVFKGGSIWQYKHNGASYQRRFLPDGSAELFVNGERSTSWKGFTWRMDGEKLLVDKPVGGVEIHRLDSKNRLVLPAGLGTAEKVE